MWVSTAMVGWRKAMFSTTLAVLRPTPGRVCSLSRSAGFPLPRPAAGCLVLGPVRPYIGAMSSSIGEPVLFDAVLTPYRSLSPRGFAILMGAAGLIGFAFGAGFIALGAWPIFGFCGV